MFPILSFGMNDKCPSVLSIWSSEEVINVERVQLSAQATRIILDICLAALARKEQALKETDDMEVAVNR